MKQMKGGVLTAAFGQLFWPFEWETVNRRANPGAR